MKFRKKLTTTIMVLSMMATMTACSSSETTTSSTTSSTTTSSEAASTTETSGTTSAEGTVVNTEEPAPDTNSEVQAEGYNIAIITSPNSVDDGSFNEDNYNGIVSFISSRGNVDIVTPIQETTASPAGVFEVVSGIVADYDILVCTGFQSESLAPVVTENPDKYFIVVDTFLSNPDGGDSLEYDNAYAMLFAEEESGFFAGVAAALETKTGKVAVVNGQAFPSNVNYQFGFESGVAYAVANLGATAECVELSSYAGTDVTGANVGGNYTGNFIDEAAGKVLGNALLQEDCDIIFVAAGGSGNGVFASVKEASSGAMVIGCDVDQFDDGVNGANNIVLTSAIKNMSINVERQLNAVADDDFIGGNHVLTADSSSTGYISADGRHQLSDDTLATLEDIYDLVANGTIIPAANFNGYTSDSFPGL